ncbi:OLC1v1007500C1 [Oldenlandia corymbosa var. corymbosa]|uniref:OLC1v1007500C1 n=1 Tax=Oldenlandia corymbosa var. corymbosa TaxID=529605 RepID=A0AAV1DJE9_OLDCO|nr:OLC1v1007500C1 [Oldenlandia corymbosa var. corymbosa]
MVRRRRIRKIGYVADSFAAPGNSDKKNSKILKKTVKVVRKSNREDIAPEKIKKKDENDANSVVEVEAEQSDNKYPEPAEKHKSLSQELVQSKEGEPALEVKTENENKRKRNKEEKRDTTNKKHAGNLLNSQQRNKEKENDVERREERTKVESGKNIGGMIFMCNAKTKPDCFQYRVMGVSASKQDMVMRIRPGLKLFLFDFDLKVMYGIYEAASAGGMKLEPAAFGGGFPAQVRFKIYKDCLSLPESIFKKAIKDSYDEKTHKFKTELTVDQVRRLTVLFRPVPILHSYAKSSLPEEIMPPSNVQPEFPLPTEEVHRRQQEIHREQLYGGRKLQEGSSPVDHSGRHTMQSVGYPQHERPLFLTEKEYRSYGLRSEREVLPTTVTVRSPTTHTYEKYMFDYRGERLQSNPPPVITNAVTLQKEPSRPSLLFPSEKEYRTFGLKGVQNLPSRQPPVAPESSRSFEDSRRNGYDPYDDSTTSLVNRYLSLPGPLATTTTAEPYFPSGKGAAAYVNTFSRYTSEPKYQSLRLNPQIERERLHHAPPNPSLPALSNYNSSQFHHLGGDFDPTSTSVSSCYSFGGPPSLPRR